MVECERVVVWSFEDSHSVSSYRVPYPSTHFLTQLERELSTQHLQTPGTVAYSERKREWSEGEKEREGVEGEAEGEREGREEEEDGKINKQEARRRRKEQRKKEVSTLLSVTLTRYLSLWYSGRS